MIDIEDWVIDILNMIKSCRDQNVDGYKIVLNKEQIKIIADAYDKVDWIEIY